MRILLLLIFSLFFSCTANKKDALSSEFPLSAPMIEIPGGDAPIDFVSSWNLTSLFDSEGTKNTGYWKSLDGVNYIFPSAWDRNNNVSGDPTENEPYIKLPAGDVSAILLDELKLSISSFPVMAVRVIWSDSTESMIISQIAENLAVSEFFTLKSKGQVNIRNMGQDDVQIQSDEPLGEGIRRTQYNFQDLKFKAASPVILDKSALAGYQGSSGNAGQSPSARLKGPWVFEETLSDSLFTPSDLNKDRVIVDFSPEKKQVVFSRNDMAEIFKWSATTPLLTGILISLRNSFIEGIAQSAIVQFINKDRILVRFQGDVIWTGIYRRMNRQEKNYSVEQQNMILQTYGVELSGSYKSAQGQEFFFDYPNLMIVHADGQPEEKGLYAILKINKQDILEARTFDQNGRVKNRYTYEFTNSERKEGTRLIRSFVVTPGNLYVYGVESDRVNSITFEQISTEREF